MLVQRTTLFSPIDSSATAPWGLFLQKLLPDSRTASDVLPLAGVTGVLGVPLF